MFVTPSFSFGRDRGRSPLRLHKAHADGKQDETVHNPEAQVSALKLGSQT